MKKNVFKIALLLIITISLVQNTIAQSSYIYIEAIKGMPISVNINGNEIKSLARNYLLFETKQEGENNVEIKFAGNLYPPQKFVVNTVSNAQYGYKLAKANEDKFYLLDLVNNGKIIELNTSVNFAFSTDENKIHFYNPQNYVLEEVKTKGNKASNLFKKKSAKNGEGQPTITKIEKEEKYGIVEVINSNSEKTNTIQVKEKIKNKKKEKLLKQEEDTNSKVIVDTLQVEKEVAPLVVKKKKKEKVQEVTTLAEEKTVLVNNPILPIIKEEHVKPVVPKAVSKCVREASDVEINSFVEKLAIKTDDEAKLIFMKKKFFTGCISTKQLYSIVEKFDTQYGRFTVVKFIKPEIIDAENLGTLQPLFKYETYKQKLKKLTEE
jgi:hypothetical protein